MLEQVNSKEEPDWKVWEQPDDYPSRGLLALRAAESARQQGEAAFDSFHYALLQARHEQRREISDVKTLTEVAKSVKLDIKRFQKDLSDRRLLTRIAENHTFATETLGIFGTPTLVFPEGQVIFLKLSSIPSPDECLPVFTELYHLASQRRYIQEIKRPQPPKRDS